MTPKCRLTIQTIKRYLRSSTVRREAEPPLWSSPKADATIFLFSSCETLVRKEKHLHVNIICISNYLFHFVKHQPNLLTNVQNDRVTKKCRNQQIFFLTLELFNRWINYQSYAEPSTPFTMKIDNMYWGTISFNVKDYKYVFCNN